MSNYNTVQNRISEMMKRDQNTEISQILEHVQTDIPSADAYNELPNEIKGYLDTLLGDLESYQNGYISLQDVAEKIMDTCENIGFHLDGDFLSSTLDAYLDIFDKDGGEIDFGGYNSYTVYTPAKPYIPQSDEQERGTYLGDAWVDAGQAVVVQHLGEKFSAVLGNKPSDDLNVWVRYDGQTPGAGYNTDDEYSVLRSNVTKAELA